MSPEVYVIIYPRTPGILENRVQKVIFFPQLCVEIYSCVIDSFPDLRLGNLSQEINGLCSGEWEPHTYSLHPPYGSLLCADSREDHSLGSLSYLIRFPVAFVFPPSCVWADLLLSPDSGFTSAYSLSSMATSLCTGGKWGKGFCRTQDTVPLPVPHCSNLEPVRTQGLGRSYPIYSTSEIRDLKWVYTWVTVKLNKK